MTQEEDKAKRKELRESLRTSMRLSDAKEQEIVETIKKVACLNYEVRDGHLFVGTGWPPRYEIRQALGGGQVY